MKHLTQEMTRKTTNTEEVHLTQRQQRREGNSLAEEEGTKRERERLERTDTTQKRGTTHPAGMHHIP